MNLQDRIRILAVAEERATEMVVAGIANGTMVALDWERTFTQVADALKAACEKAEADAEEAVRDTVDEIMAADGP